MLAAMRDGFWQKFTVKAGDEVTGRANGKRRDGKTRDADQGSEGAENRRARTPVVIVGGAVIRALDNNDVVGKGLPVAE